MDSGDLTNHDCFNHNKLEDFTDEAYLFDPNVLNELCWETNNIQFKGNINHKNPGPNLKVRPLRSGDFGRSYASLLSQLTSIGDISEESFKKRFFDMKLCSNSYYVVVVEDILIEKVVGTASIIIEQKFIHSTGLRSRIEDVVVDEEYRGHQLGKLLVQLAILLSKKFGCYKVSLECKEHNINFYKTFGFNTDQTYLVKRFTS